MTIQIDKKFSEVVVGSLFSETSYTDFNNDVGWFTPEEMGDSARGANIDLRLMWRLDLMRDVADSPIVIHSAYCKFGHSAASFHYKGMAADLHVKGLSLEEMVRLAALIGFPAIGVYPYWNTPGIHVDVRPTDGRIATWERLPDGQYVELSEKFRSLLPWIVV